MANVSYIHSAQLTYRENKKRNGTKCPKDVLNEIAAEYGNVKQKDKLKISHILIDKFSY